ncbi:hypothetical protein [Bacillus safensis]
MISALVYSNSRTPDEDRGCLLELKGKGCRQFDLDFITFYGNTCID